MKKLYFLLIYILLLTSSAYSEIESTDYLKGWRIYAGDKTETTITENENEVILKGNGIKSGYILGASNIKDAKAWHRQYQGRFSIHLTTPDIFTMYIPIETNNGLRFLTYTTHPDHINKRGKEGRFIYIKLSDDEKVTGKSKVIARNLNSDLHHYEPDNDLVEVNGLMMRGDCTITNINIQSSKDYYLVKAPFYENGTSFYKWRVYAGGEKNAKITTDYYYPLTGILNNPVVSLQGNGIKSGYILGDIEGKKAWHNKTETIIKWEMIYPTIYTVYVPIKTTKGIRFMTYTNHPDHKDKRGKEGKLIYLGTNDINAKTNSDTIKFKKNLRQDLAKYEPDNKILEVNGFMVRGSCLIDNVILQKEKKARTLKFNEDRFSELLERERIKLENNREFTNVELIHTHKYIAWFTYDYASNTSAHMLQPVTLDRENKELKNLIENPYSKVIYFIDYNSKLTEDGSKLILILDDGYDKIEYRNSYIFNHTTEAFLTEELYEDFR